MSYVFQASSYFPAKYDEDHATAEAAIEKIEALGEGRVVKFNVEPNLPHCLPEFVHRCVGMWSYGDGIWNHHYIYDGHGGVMDHEKPE